MLDLGGVTSFADYFVICTGNNSKQVQAIADEVGWQLKKVNEHPISVEGYTQAEWILADYGDLLIHVFSTKAREYYDLEAFVAGRESCADSRVCQRLKVFLYYIGKPRDAHANRIAEDFVERASRYAPTQMLEIRPDHAPDLIT